MTSSLSRSPSSLLRLLHYIPTRSLSSHSITDKTITVLGKTYQRDENTNVTSAILDKVGRNLHYAVPHHPIRLLKERVVHHFHSTYTNAVGNAIYASIEDTPPVVTVEQNFDSLQVIN